MLQMRLLLELVSVALDVIGIGGWILAHDRRLQRIRRMIHMSKE